ncbi:hypothetical protein IGI04_004646 [Brassica rapa subsp. trilocularis]|uniref:FBD domain-containing protein n=1 Tax=Brassica rapa subsp. trilocularis TaxID=1813537 RepID=A0ABQ7NBP1_BRACM|nr:hypothetical protein IGI04_004646 [Brassica rapa subsp. trilocularis]
MSIICELSDDLLVKILSLIENMKEVVGTSLVSKRWRSLWKFVPRLDASSSDLINNFLMLSKAPVLETLHLILDENSYEPEENERWVSIAAARQVRDLELLRYGSRRNSLLSCPRSLFTCKGLVVLRLQQVAICDITSTVFLLTPKTLSLVCVRFVSGDELKNCGMFRECVPQWDLKHKWVLKFNGRNLVVFLNIWCLVSKVLSGLGTRGTVSEKEAVIHILDKSKHLKKMTLYRKITNLREKYRTLIDSKSMMSCGSTCRLEFVHSTIPLPYK